MKLSFVDVTKAYFNAVPQRSIYVRAPRELGLPQGTMGKLIRCAYGTRDAGALWEETYAHVLMDAGFIRGNASPCCFWHPQRKYRWCAMVMTSPRLEQQPILIGMKRSS